LPAGNEYGAFLFGGYDINNKLPYTENWMFDIQYQASNNWLFSAGYVGNHGQHLFDYTDINEPFPGASGPVPFGILGGGFLFSLAAAVVGAVVLVSIARLFAGHK
jgi:hypothetical protein